LKRQFVSKHDSRELIAQVERSTGVHLDVPRSAQVEILEPEVDTRFVVIDGRYTFVSGSDDTAAKGSSPIERNGDGEKQERERAGDGVGGAQRGGGQEEGQKKQDEKETGTSFVPFVGSADAVRLFPSVSIDEGAVKYIIKGADVMRPGISKYDDWGGAGRLVIVREDKKGRAAAVGKTMVASSAMTELKKGNCVKNLHHAGDRFWNAYKKI
jgi:predicted RNA-binding protein (TIGR00451 family)